MRRKEETGTTCCARAYWVVCLDMRYQKNDTPLRSRTPIQVCYRHKKTTILRQILNERLWSSICAQLRVKGIRTPKRKLTKLSFERIDEVE